MASTQNGPLGGLGDLLDNLLGIISDAVGTGAGSQLTDLVPAGVLDELTSELGTASGAATPLLDQLVGDGLVDLDTVHTIAGSADPDLSSLQDVLSGSTVPLSDLEHVLDTLFATDGNGNVTVGSLANLTSDELAAVQTLLTDTVGVASAAVGNDDGGASHGAIVGTADADILRGTAGNDIIRGGGGNDVIRGLGGDDALYGGIGNDRLFGQGGHDHLVGGAGNDVLNGGIGADLMEGGIGNDIYIVDSSGDRVLEAPGAGTDTVRSLVSYVLPTNVERLVLLDNAVSGTGNAAANAITGNARDNHLVGGGGNDVLNGAAGNDVLSGGAGVDHLNGGIGNDVLRGGLGSDVLSGGGGHDRFVFNTRVDGTDADRITDFQHGIDKIVLTYGVFTALGASGHLAATEFVTDSAKDGNDHIVYHAAGGQLFYDADGAGGAAAVHFATVDPGLHLTAADFLVG